MSLPQPNIIPVADRRYRLEESYTYEWTKEGVIGEIKATYHIIVPAGFLYDGASVPRLAWTISGITPDGLIRPAALIHDWLYRHQGWLPEGSYEYQNEKGVWSNPHAVWRRKEADRLFGRIMKEAGVTRRRRQLAYHAVSWFGWLAW